MSAPHPPRRIVPRSSGLPAAADPNANNFRAAFCREFHCPPAKFHDRVFWMTVFPHAKPVALLLRIFYPSYFDIESDFIGDIGQTEHATMFRDEIDIYHGNNLRTRSVLRNKFLIRISGTRMKQLGARIYGEVPR
jgi:hypothetical protein